jgi:hypothetical protein
MPPELSVETLAARIERAERLNRAFHRAVLIAFAFVIGALVFQHYRQSSRTITAERFAVINAKGDVVALLSAGANGLPSLTLSTGGNNPRALIGLNNIGSVYLALSDADNKLRWSAFADDSGVHMNDAK